MVPPVTLDHLVALSDDVGVVQHAFRDVPNRDTGYCTDDVARAFMVALAASHQPALEPAALKLAHTYLAFLHHAQLPDGRFHNFMSYERTWLDDVGSQDSIGRAVWALGYGVWHAPDPSWRTLCGELLMRSLPAIETLDFPHAKAYAALGLTYAHADPAIRAGARQTLIPIAAALTQLHANNASPGWDWFEDILTYDSPRLSEALLRIGTVTGDGATVELGLRTFRFYASIVIEDGRFVPIGNIGWYPRGGKRARYGQQPLEAAAMIDAALCAHRVTGDADQLRLANTAFDWFFGRNTLGTTLIRGGGCCDGLDEHGANPNMGAESTLAYLSGALAPRAVPEQLARPIP